MSDGAKVFSVSREFLDKFPHNDGCGGWYKIISAEEFEKLQNAGEIVWVSGRYFATSSSYTAATAAQRLRPVSECPALKNDAPVLPPPKEQVKTDTPKVNTNNANSVRYTSRPSYGQTSSDNGFGFYKNPGNTLMSIANVLFVLGTIVSIILAFALESFWIFLGGTVGSYLSGLTLAAFGDLVISAKEISRKMNGR